MPSSLTAGHTRCGRPSSDLSSTSTRRCAGAYDSTAPRVGERSHGGIRRCRPIRAGEIGRTECVGVYRLAAVFRCGWVALARRVEVAVLRCLAVFVGRMVRLSMWASAMSSAVAIGETS
jgi:hypothetical protein